MEKVKAVAMDATLVQKKHLTEDVIELYFETNPGFDFLPGQYISVIIPGAGPGGRDLRRAYSIASHPEKRIIELCVKVVERGPGSQYLHSLKVGDSMKCVGAYGHFYYKTKSHKHVVFIATGTGIAPFRSMIYSKIFNDSKPLSTHLLFGARADGDLLYTDEIMHTLGKTHFVQSLSRPHHEGGWTGHKGRVTDWLKEKSSHILWNETEFYICGNGAMIDEVKQILTSREVPKDAIHTEVYYKPKDGSEPDEE
jgi:ferredoxin-NADP reductase